MMEVFECKTVISPIHLKNAIEMPDIAAVTFLR